jgi:hypothetical protein
MADGWDDIRQWRARAEEIRTVADQFSVPSAKDTMQRLAATYERLAAEAEARLIGHAQFESEEAG